MSMLSKQIEELREVAEVHIGLDVGDVLSKAADTIESLSEKLSAANTERSERHYGGGWIPVKERTPDKEGLYIIHVITGTGEDYVGTWIYQQGYHLSGNQTWIDDKKGYWASPYNGDPINEPLSKNVVAFMPMPEPYKPEGEV